MKRLHIILLSCITACITLASCVKSDPRPAPEPEYITLDNCECAEFGDFYKKGVNDFYLQIFTGRVHEEGYLIGPATSILFDLFTPLSVTGEIPEGVYPLEESYAAGTALKGTEVTWQQRLEEEAETLSELFGETVTVEELMKQYGVTDSMLGDMIWDEGADFFTKDEKENSIDRAIKSGRVTVRRDGALYSILLDFALDGRLMHYKWEGTLNIKKGE